MPEPQKQQKRCKEVFALGGHCSNPTMTPNSDYCIECYEPVGNDCAQEVPQPESEGVDILKKHSDELNHLIFGLQHKTITGGAGIYQFIRTLLRSQAEQIRREERGRCAEIVKEAIIVCDHCEGHIDMKEAQSKILNE